LTTTLDYEVQGKCPYCGTILTGNNYEKAKHAFEEKIRAEQDEKFKKQEEYFRQKQEEKNQSQTTFHFCMKKFQYTWEKHVDIF